MFLFYFQCSIGKWARNTTITNKSSICSFKLFPRFKNAKSYSTTVCTMVQSIGLQDTKKEHMTVILST